VIGDAAYLVDSATGQTVPGVSQGALQMGRYVAKVIEAELRSGGSGAAAKLRTTGFHYKDLGSMATVGKSRAVVEIGRLHFGGLLAWFAWMALHITVLIGFRNRVSVLLSWIYSYMFFRRGSRLITGLAPTSIKQPIAPATSTLPTGVPAGAPAPAPTPGPE
jgi:NADH dehydrogenase